MFNRLRHFYYGILHNLARQYIKTRVRAFKILLIQTVQRESTLQQKVVHVLF